MRRLSYFGICAPRRRLRLRFEAWVHFCYRRSGQHLAVTRAINQLAWMPPFWTGRGTALSIRQLAHVFEEITGHWFSNAHAHWLAASCRAESLSAAAALPTEQGDQAHQKLLLAYTRAHQHRPVKHRDRTPPAGQSTVRSSPLFRACALAMGCLLAGVGVAWIFTRRRR